MQSVALPISRAKPCLIVERSSAVSESEALPSRRAKLCVVSERSFEREREITMLAAELYRLQSWFVRVTITNTNTFSI